MDRARTVELNRTDLVAAEGAGGRAGGPVARTSEGAELAVIFELGRPPGADLAAAAAAEERGESALSGADDCMVAAARAGGSLLSSRAFPIGVGSPLKATIQCNYGMLQSGGEFMLTAVL